jgi:microcystin-dependent protein
MPSQLSKGTPAFNNYPGTNSQVTADLLNNLVDNGTILPGAISEQSLVAAATSDEVLIRRPGTNLLHKTTVDSIVSNTVIPIATNIPIGGILIWGSTSVPTNWLECNGAAINQATYPALYAIYGTNLPDLRGVFIRGANRGRANMDPDVNRQPLTFQDDDYQQHSHTVPEGGFQTNIFGQYYTSNNATPANQRAAQTTSTSGGSTETRPVNVAMLYIVRAL